MSDSASKALADQNSSDSGEAVGKAAVSFDDSTLIARFRKGDVEAFGSLVRKYQDRVFNVVLRMVSNRAEAEELSQDAFLKAMQKIDQFKGKSKFYTWLFRIAVNLALSHRRRGSKMRTRSIDGLEELYGSQAHSLTVDLAQRRSPGPVKEAIRAETQQCVISALNELEDDFRVVIVLRDLEEMDYQQVSDVLELPIGTVKSRLHRARLMLKEKLAGVMRDGHD